ncbi:MAG: class I SAM-dependent methyltransferase [Halobacteriales archaeon]
MKRVVRENFDLSVEAYREYEAATGRFRTLARRLRDAMAARGASFDRVLDAGAGTGASTAVFAEAGRAVALDASRPMLAPNAAGDRLQGDLERLPLRDDSVDAVAFTASLFLVPDPERAAREARRVLRDGGVVGATVPEGWFTGGEDVFDDRPRESRSPRSVADVRTALASAFTVEAGRWSFDTSPGAVRAFHDTPAGAARLYPKLPPAERRAKARDLLEDLSGPIEHRWRWFVGR